MLKCLFVISGNNPPKVRLQGSTNRLLSIRPSDIEIEGILIATSTARYTTEYFNHALTKHNMTVLTWPAAIRWIY